MRLPLIGGVWVEGKGKSLEILLSHSPNKKPQIFLLWGVGFDLGDLSA
jgi:hypothetical protein